MANMDPKTSPEKNTTHTSTTSHEPPVVRCVGRRATVGDAGSTGVRRGVDVSRMKLAGSRHPASLGDPS